MKKHQKLRNEELRKGIIVEERPFSPISEEYRAIRTNIEFSIIDRELRTLICTSPNPSEGKSTTIANLAFAFAQQDKSVLLVDADLRKPTVHTRFHLRNHRGLTNVLVEKLNFEDVIMQAGNEKLWILTAGMKTPNPAELLGSNAMKEFIEVALNKFDLILFDTPPLLAVSDARILGNACDGTLLVVRSGSTKKEALVRSKELLDRAQVPIIGTVLNDLEIAGSNTYYYGR